MVGLINSMQEHRLVKSIYEWESITSRRQSRLNKTDVLNDLKIMKVNNCMKVVQHQSESQRVLEKVIKSLCWIVKPVEQEEEEKHCGSFPQVDVTPFFPDSIKSNLIELFF